MSGNITNKNNSTTSDQLHNENCYHYLKNLVLTPFVLSKFPPNIERALKQIKNQSEYNSRRRYADLYKAFFTYLEDNINRIYDEPQEEHLKIILSKSSSVEECRSSEKVIIALNTFINSIYHNDNGILEKTFEVIQTIPFNHVPSATHIEKAITDYISDKGQKINKIAPSPVEAGSIIGRLTSILATDFKPQHTTGLSTIRHYHYNDNRNNPITEYRFGTQGQRHGGIARVSPLFERWLNIQAMANSYQDNKITHIYFNNLGRDRQDSEGTKEKALTAVLEKLEQNNKNIAVITLPADKGLMAQDDYKEVAQMSKRDDIFKEFFTIAKNNQSRKLTDICDFYISPKIRGLLFSSDDHEISQLLDNSFNSLGMANRETLSKSEKQAVWFHFIKFELTNYIIDTLKPKSINFSCKDAIDRGGVSSLYYHLIKSLSPDSPCPLSRDEFEKGLHAAPAMVKGRGMNHHLNLIWNTVDVYINANYNAIKGTNKAWLIEWRDLNCPHERVSDLLLKRLKQCRDELQNATSSTSIKTGLLILDNIEQQINYGVSGKRLLLEAIIRTPEIALNPSSDSAKRYGQLADELAVKNPLCKQLWGLMKVLAGVFICSNRLINSGWATKKSGEHAKVIDTIRGDMKTICANDEDINYFHP